LCDDVKGGLNGDSKMVAQSIKVFLNEAAARLAKGTVSATLI
jgi:hypothetical protein